MDGLRICLLGAVQVHADGRTLPLRSRPQRAVLARLALERDRPVSIGALIDLLWPDDPPANAAGNLHSYVSKLRKVIGAERIVGEHGGYRLRIDEAAVDVGQAEQLSALAAARADARQRAELLGEAVALWRGEPLADLEDVPGLTPDRVRLSALRHELELGRLAALVDAGHHVIALPDLERACVRDPHDEALARLLVRALHGLGRSSEALRTASRFRQRIAEDTGLDATGELADLERRILDDDPVLRQPPDAADDPRPETAPAPASASWPRFTTPLHGRSSELAQLEALLGSERIVTVTGPGGMGKTRMASALADRWAASGRRVHFFPLASLTAEDDVAASVAAGLGLRVQSGQDPSTNVGQLLGRGGQLLVLDNAEHVLEPVRRLVDRVTDPASDLTVLLTSRAPLGLGAECVHRLPPLRGDDAGREIFLERARRVRPGWEPDEAEEAAIRTIVDRLGGLPLAIELAAGRTTSLTIADLAARIGDLDLLTDGRPTARHRTVRATVDWSYQLLPRDARRLLCALSVFPAGVDLATAEEVAGSVGLAGGGATQLVTLVEASLVDAELGRPARYSILEPVRAYAEERLHAADEDRAAIAVRAEWARRTARWIDEVGRGPEEARADARLRAELANLRAAHRTALRDDDLDTAITISAGLMRAATFRDLPELWSWALALAEHPGVGDHPRSGEALGAAAEAAWLTGDLRRGERLATLGLSSGTRHVPCLQALASIRLFLGEAESAHALWMEASRHGSVHLPQAGLAAVYMHDLDRAAAVLADAEAWATAEGSPTDLAVARYATGELLAPDVAAVRPYEDAIALASSVGSTFVASISRVGLAATLAASGEHVRAIDEFDTVVRYWRRTGNWTQQWTTLRNVADLLDALGRPSTAARIRVAAATAPSAAADRTGAVPTPTIAAPGQADAIVASVLDEIEVARGQAAGAPAASHPGP